MRAHGGKRVPNWVIGLVMAAVLIVASYFAFTRNVPWGKGTEVRVVFNSAQNLRVDSQVRIAGVEVGKVTSVEPLDAGSEDGEDVAAGSVPTGAVVTMEIDDDGLPLKEDAHFTLKPRLFLEGNLFVDVQPGSPGSPTVDTTDYTFPPSQTANTVQLDQILTGSLQADVRKNLQVFLDEFGSALVDEGGAQSLRTLNKVSPGAFRYTSEVNQAVLGENPHDLSSLIVNLDRVIRGLDADEPALQDLITNLRITTGSFAQQSVPLEAAIRELPNTIEAGNTAFASLNAAFPNTRAFAREILPGVRTAPATLDAATPLLQQLKLLARPQELRGLVADLRPTVPNLAELTRETIPFLEQSRALSSCFNTVILPWADDRVTGGSAYDSQHGAQGRVFEETGYGLAGISGESRSGDANGQYIRVIAGGGTNTVVTNDQSTGGTLQAGLTPFPIDGAMPPLSASAKTPFKPEVPCETQEPPNLAAVPGPPPQQQSTELGAAPTSGTAAEIYSDSENALTLLAKAAAASDDGDKKAARRIGADAMKAMSDFYDKYGN
ncbi:MAG: MCE family protein [Solirubrobacterales bacterium]|nr:MCE family protein [Solirubrobacterales bacterium]MCB8969267.1 MCE family protein [Thermoleophilales bacterium]MCO5328200.1 MlaD family protein [Solirubrobacterales bacterium]